MDIVSILNEQPDYIKSHNYWRWLKRKLKLENNELVSATHSFKFIAPDGKNRLADTLDSDGVIELAKNFPNTKAVKFLDWFLYSDNTNDGQSKKKVIIHTITKNLENLRSWYLDKCVIKIIMH